jgi:L-ascorbate metabolism protein UlaG (beta-lactamase superfamily)
MIITYFGKQFWKITQGELTIAFNPVSKNSKTGISSRFGADIALVSANHPDYNGTDQLSYGDRMPFVIDGPGDYEVKGIFIKGAASNTTLGGKKYVNTIYSLSVDGMNMVFLGALASPELSKDAGESIESPDILFVPVGNKEVLDAKSSAKLVAALEPKVVIPMDYDPQSLKSFLKEMGDENAETVEKLSLRSKDLEGKEGQVVIVKAG